jgi:S-disulfanyl-L-cysteine oxidoreductase SoxD
MKVKIAVAALAVLVGFGAYLAPVTATSGQTASLADGVYTTEQAERGQAVYDDKCSACHVQDLSGGGDGMAPSLAGRFFNKTWEGRTVAELYASSMMMPPGEEKTVSDQERIDIIAYVLQFNKFPAGDTELEADMAKLKPLKLSFTQ